MLVVEDFGELRELLAAELTRAGFAVESAGSAQQALDLRPESYDALVVDHRLGAESGTAVFRILCDRDAAIASRFILITGDDHGVDLPVGVPILLKPFRIGVLVDALRSVVTRPGTAG